MIVTYSAEDVVCPVPVLTPNQQEDERRVRVRVSYVVERGLHRCKDLPPHVLDLYRPEADMVVGEVGALDSGAACLPHVVGITVPVSGKVHGALGLIAPHDADLG